ncbi:MAG: RNA-binding S4 domain-containing protein [Bacteroidales bacterium]|nr:RNA-binding S4 domain-containing protein [Bacteroidales bacterium]MBQ2482431.1 RNA-binding S4 domain-containing protein [Bacteroidales bacterium]MBQ2493068.1 RNA-binding S4 domain-containing protein [Bacteroidales bacterium]
MDTVRIDKYLWAIRAFKTRSEAAEACRSGKVYVNGSQVKSSKEIKKSDEIEVRKGAVHYKYLVVEPIDKRQGAKLVDQFATNVTPQSELDKLVAPVETIFLKRERGSGRPTKKERRDIDRLMDGF